MANTYSDDKRKLGTRLMAAEHELQRRDRLLKTMLALKKVDQGLGMDLLGKLREERKLLPIYRQKLKDVQDQIAGLDEEIRAQQHHERYTRIMELQVEYASWQHELQRLESILQDPLGAAARQELDVNLERVTKLEARFTELQGKLQTLNADLSTARDEHAAAEGEATYQQGIVTEQQEAVSAQAEHCKELMLQRREVEHIEQEIEQLKVESRMLTTQLEETDAHITEEEAARESTSASIHRAVMSSAYLGPLPDLPTPSAPVWALWRTLAAGGSSTDPALLSLLLTNDGDLTGGLSKLDLAFSLKLAAQSCHLAQDAALACSSLTSPVDEATSSSPGQGDVRWLDWLVTFDRIADLPMSSPLPPPLPERRPLRRACLRARCSAEDLRQRLSSITSLQAAQACFSGLGLDGESLAAWVEVWQHFGTAGLLARLPLGEVAAGREALEAWLQRCAEAVQEEQQDLRDALTEVEDPRRLPEADFCTLFQTFLTARLSRDDAEDLALLASDEDGFVDGEAFLRIWCMP